jgi:hypothetical protein
MRNFYQERSQPLAERRFVLVTTQPQPPVVQPVVPQQSQPAFGCVSWVKPEPEVGTRQKIEAVICKVFGFTIAAALTLVFVFALAPFLLVAWVLWPVAIGWIVFVCSCLYIICDISKNHEEDQRRIIREELEAFQRRNF